MNNTLYLLLCALAALLFALAVSSTATAQRMPGWPECDPLCPTQCTAPWPNDFYAVRDATSANTGLRLNLTEAMLPQARSKKHDRYIDPHTMRLNERDGWSVGGPIVFSLGLGSHVPDLEAAGAATWKNISISISPARTPTMLVDLGPASPSSNSSESYPQLVPHWVENDIRSEPLAFEHEKAILIYPAQILNPGHRYAVAVRNLHVKTILGGLKPIAPSAAFQSIIDGAPLKDDPSVVGRFAEFNALFATLSKSFKVDKSSLQLAWWFTTQSDQSSLRRFESMRRDALARVPAAGPKFFINESATVFNPNNRTHAYMYGTVEVPLYVSGEKPGATFVLDPATQLPVFQKLANVSFELVVPTSFVAAQNQHVPFGLLHIGHGLFMTESIVQKPTYELLYDADHYIGACTNWWGLDTYDIPFVAESMLDDFNKLISVPDRLAQSVVNHLYLTKMFKLSLARHPLFENRLNTSQTRYTADSLGTMMGEVLVTASPDLDMAVFRVGGAPFGLLLPRSGVFTPMWDILVARGYTVFDRMLMINLLDMLLANISPPAFLRHLVDQPLFGNKPKRVVLMRGLSDALVTSISGEVSARTVKAMRFANTLHEEGEEVFGFGATINAPSVRLSAETGGAVFQMYQFGYPTPNPPMPLGDKPVAFKYNTHPCTRNDPRATALMRHFFNTEGEVKNFCDPVKGCFAIKETPKCD